MSASALFLLSVRGLANIPQNERRDDSEFIVGSSRARYCCHSFVADFLSLLICDLHSTDETISAFEIRIKDEDFKFATSCCWAGALGFSSLLSFAKNCGTRNFANSFAALSCRCFNCELYRSSELTSATISRPMFNLQHRISSKFWIFPVCVLMFSGKWFAIYV
jgi:hypothetical protein